MKVLVALVVLGIFYWGYNRFMERMTHRICSERPSDPKDP